MTISLPGVLERAAARLEKTRDMKHLAFDVRLLLKHLRILRKEPEQLARFMELWSDSDADNIEAD